MVKLVKKMIPQFNNGDIWYVRCPRTGKNGVLNVECRSINVASAVKSTFAGLVKSEKPPSYLKNVGYFIIDLEFGVTCHFWYSMKFVLLTIPLISGFYLIFAHIGNSCQAFTDAICFKASEGS